MLAEADASCPGRGAARQRRACLAPHIHCSNAPPLPPSTPEQRARTMAHVQRVMREIEARREQGE